MREQLQIGDIVTYEERGYYSVGVIVRPYINTLGKTEAAYPFEVEWFSMPWENKAFCVPIIDRLKKVAHINV